MHIYDENFYSNKMTAIDEARKNIYEDSVSFDLSFLWRKFLIGGLSRRVMIELGLIDISSDPRWNHKLEDCIMAVYSDELGRAWTAEDLYGKTVMRLRASDINVFENQISSRYDCLKAA